MDHILAPDHSHRGAVSSIEPAAAPSPVRVFVSPWVIGGED
jgi:hypothetical protein